MKIHNVSLKLNKRGMTLIEAVVAVAIVAVCAAAMMLAYASSVGGVTEARVMQRENAQLQSDAEAWLAGDDTAVDTAVDVIAAESVSFFVGGYNVNSEDYTLGKSGEFNPPADSDGNIPITLYAFRPNSNFNR